MPRIYDDDLIIDLAGRYKINIQILILPVKRKLIHMLHGQFQRTSILICIIIQVLDVIAFSDHRITHQIIIAGALDLDIDGPCHIVILNGHIIL